MGTRENNGSGRRATGTSYPVAGDVSRLSLYGGQYGGSLDDDGISSVITKRETMPFSATRMDPEVITLGEIRQKGKDHMIALIRVI